MADTETSELLELTAHDSELKAFFDRVRQVGKLVVKDGQDEFVVECRRVTISDEARRRLTSNGPDGD